MTAKYLLKQAYRQGNLKAADYMISYGLIKQKEDLDTELVLNDEDVASFFLPVHSAQA